MTFLGYLRPDGRAGTRNHVLIFPTVICATAVAQMIQRAVPGTVAVDHPHGCGHMGEEKDLIVRAMAGVCGHPNVGGVVLVGLGFLWSISEQPVVSSSAARVAGGASARLGSSNNLPYTVTTSGPYTPTLSVAVRDLPNEPDLPILDREPAQRDDRGFVGPSIQMPPHGNLLAELQQMRADALPAISGRHDQMVDPGDALVGLALLVDVASHISCFGRDQDQVPALLVRQ